MSAAKFVASLKNECRSPVDRCDNRPPPTNLKAQLLLLRVALDRARKKARLQCNRAVINQICLRQLLRRFLGLFDGFLDLFLGGLIRLASLLFGLLVSRADVFLCLLIGIRRGVGGLVC